MASQGRRRDPDDRHPGRGDREGDEVAEETIADTVDLNNPVAWDRDEWWRLVDDGRERALDVMFDEAYEDLERDAEDAEAEMRVDVARARLVQAIDMVLDLGGDDLAPVARHELGSLRDRVTRRAWPSRTWRPRSARERRPPT